MNLCFEKTLVEQCAPTLTGVKPANLFRVAGTDLAALRKTVTHWDRMLEPLGLRLVILKECQATVACMIYLFRPAWLSAILRKKENRAFLKRMGYPMEDDMEQLSVLSRRLCLEQEYPHEIGVFLGYPLEDVIGFIENKGWNYTCCGYWKCYGDPVAAQARFARYRACTAACKKKYRQGIPVIQLVTAA